MSQHFSSSSPASRTHLFGTINTTTTLDRTAFWTMLSTKEIVGTTIAVVVTIFLIAFHGLVPFPVHRPRSEEDLTHRQQWRRLRDGIE
jgi:hypothetical protein